MASTILPYNLRTNKSVDRSIFMELLMKINPYHSIEKYTYIGFGAIHMEEMKMIHNMFGVDTMLSIENDKTTFIRQEFNKPLNCIQLINSSAGQFIDEYDFDDNCIVWLDYVTPRQLATQFREFQTLISKCGIHDILKISINSNPDALGELRYGEEREATLKGRLEKLRSRIGQFLDEETTWNDMTKDNLPLVLLNALINASNEITKSNSKKLHIITSFVYSDVNHQMLTITGIILENHSDFIKRMELESWKYYSTDERKILRINIPDLTLKERLIIDSMLPLNGDDKVLEQLGYDEIPDFYKNIESYTEFYRHYPNFSKILV